MNELTNKFKKPKFGLFRFFRSDGKQMMLLKRAMKDRTNEDICVGC